MFNFLSYVTFLILILINYMIFIILIHEINNDMKFYDNII